MDLPIPIPPRFRWLKRLSIASATLLLALIALRLTWGQVAHARLQREIDRQRTTGQPVTLEEFNAQLAAIRPDDNAALLYEQAMDILVTTATDGSTFDNFNDDEIPAPFITRAVAAEELFTNNAPVYDLLRKARDRNHVAWSGGLNPNLANLPLIMLRQLARSLAFAALHHFHTGNHEQAIETLIDFHHFNQAVAQHPTAISSLVAWACDALAYDLIAQHAKELSLTADPTALGHFPTSRPQVNRLIELYLDEDPARQLAARARRGDAAMMNSLFLSSGYIPGFFGVTGLPRGFRLLEELVDVLVAPVQAAESLQTYTREYLVSKVVGELDWPQGSQLLISSDISHNLIDVFAFPQSRSPFLAPAKLNYQSANLFFRHLATRRMAAIALAIRLYEIDHGRRPTKLTALVPDYLSALPPDPFAPSGESFQYAYEIPYGAGRAYLYTVGVNGLDNGGVLQDPSANRTRSADDVHLYLDPEPLFIPPVPLPIVK